jgi:hypothetical protein
LRAEIIGQFVAENLSPADRVHVILAGDLLRCGFRPQAHAEIASF